jgi:hypothetical protein
MSANPSREELAALGRTLVTFICRLGEDRCERCNGTAACDACFAALQATLRYHRLARTIEARLATVLGSDARDPRTLPPAEV